MAETGHSKKAKRKKKSKTAGLDQQNGASNGVKNGSMAHSTMAAVQAPPPPPPPPPPLNTATTVKSTHSISRDRIWDTSTQEERERIKEFWLSLSEEERRSLVKVEKEAVLRKMKEQQKHSCSCTVCGRKRTAIEEELEVLYDAYYQELEQYANHQQVGLGVPPPTMAGLRQYGPPSAPHHYSSNHPRPAPIEQRQFKGRVEELPDDDEEEEEYSEDDDDEEEADFSDDEMEPDPRGTAADFFNFGNSLTVQGASCGHVSLGAQR